MIDRAQRFNVYTHLFGLLLALACMPVLLAATAAHLDATALAGVTVFCVAAILLYSASAACHWTRGEAHDRWQRMDHAASLLLIVGSYTPFALAAPRNPASLLLLAVMWGMAIAASIWQVRQAEPLPPAVMWCAALGWLGIVAAAPVAARAGAAAFGCLLASGLLYSVGTVFYRNRPRWRYGHGVWHLFVVAGTTANFGALYFLFQGSA